MSLRGALIRLLVRADVAAARYQDRRLEVAIESAWGEFTGPENPPRRCHRRYVVEGLPVRCIRAQHSDHTRCRVWFEAEIDRLGRVEIRQAGDYKGQGPIIG